MRQLNRRLLITVAACGLSMVGLSACSSAEEHKTKTVNYEETAPVRTLVIKGTVGDIKVSGEATSVSVTEKHSYQTAEPVASHSLVDGTYTLSYTCPDSKCGVDYTVQVPAGTAVQVTSETGDINLSKLTGGIGARTGTGRIEATDLSSPQVQLTTDTGDVTAGFVKSPSSVSAKVSTGDVRIAVPAGQYAVDARSESGDVHVEVPQAADSSSKIIAKTDTGSVTVSNA
ncbi:DUF4097 family beta strand repeat-containing protein [Streptomyces sp. NPDC046557]|uniref:DUF4097 family beta strand repeat-containing protein n=1 Tax=Streptomyces sp. NPDC046557 TaxID=3155372 RepID=UPI00340F6055